MGPNSHQLSPSANVLMQFVLKINEGGIGTRGELEVAQDRTGEERSDFGRLQKGERQEPKQRQVPYGVHPGKWL